MAAGKGARRRSHRLECDIILVLGREDLRVTVALKEIHADSACRSRDRERRPLFHESKAVVETAVAQSRVEASKGFLITGRYPARVEYQLPHRGQFQPPVGARKLRKN